MATVSGDIVAHRVKFYEVIRRNGKNIVEFNIPFYVTRLAWEVELKGGQTFLEPESIPEIRTGRVKVTEIHEIKELNRADDQGYARIVGEDPFDVLDPIVLHQFCSMPRA